MKTEAAVADRFVMANGLRLHYREWGRPDLPVVLIFHGITGHAWEFDDVASALADTFRVIVVNQRGHGASSWAQQYSPDVMADDVAAIIDNLSLDTVRIIGHSMGGVNSWTYAARHPRELKKLVLLDIDPEVICSEKNQMKILSILNWYGRGRFVNAEQALESFLSAAPGSNPQKFREFVLHNLKEESDGSVIWRFDTNGLRSWVENAFSPEKHRSALKRIEVPTLLVYGAQSMFTSSETGRRMARQMPHAQMVEIPDAGHDVHLDQGDALISLLRRFLIE